MVMFRFLHLITGQGSGSDNESDIGRKKKKKVVGSGSDSEDNVDGKFPSLKFVLIKHLK